MARSTQDLRYLLALEVTNLRLAVELAASAFDLGRYLAAREHLRAVEAPGRCTGRGQGGDSAGGYREHGGSTGAAAGDWRLTRPSLLVDVVQERRWRSYAVGELRELELELDEDEVWRASQLEQHDRSA